MSGKSLRGFLPLASTYTYQVHCFSSRGSLGQHGWVLTLSDSDRPGIELCCRNVACRPKHGAIPDSVSPRILLGLLRAGWQYLSGKFFSVRPLGDR